MKLVAFGLILICCHVWAIETKNYPADTYATKFEEFLQKFKEILQKGNETLGIPPLDPFIADEIPIDIGEDMIEDLILKGLLTNVNVDGLSAYDVNQGDFVLLPPKVSLNLTWQLVIADTDYNIKGKLADFDIYGKGNIKLSAKHFNVAATVTFGLKGLYVEVKDVKTQLSLKELNFRATGLLYDEEISELLSAIISDMVPQLIDDYQDMITEKVNALVADVLGDFLKDKTLNDILKMIGIKM